MTMNLESLKQRVRSILDVKQTTVVPLFSAALGYKSLVETTDHNMNHDSSDDVTIIRPMWGGHVAFGGSHTRSLYYNAALFVRVNLPFGIFIGVRWAGKDPQRKESFQCGLGHKLNGVFAFTFRIQSDASQAAGTYGPNHGQVQGWWYGTK